MKRLVWMVLMVGSLFASSLVVKDANVTVSIDSKKQPLQKGQNIDIAKGSQICFEGGAGRVVIDGQVELSLKSDDKCKTLIKKKKISLKDFEEWLKKNIENVVQLFAQTKEQVKLAVTRKGGEVETAKGEIVLKALDEYLVIKNDTWMPFPIELRVLDSRENVVYREINDKDDVTLFIVSREFLRDGYRVLVSNGFGDFVVDVKIAI